MNIDTSNLKILALMKEFWILKKHSTHQIQNRFDHPNGPNRFEHILRKQNPINKNTNISLETL